MGITSAVVGLTNLVAEVISLGVGAGCQRFFGLRLGHGDKEGLKAYFWSSAMFIFLIYLFASSALLILGLLGMNVGAFTSSMFFLASVILFFQASVPFQSLLTSLLKTDVIFYAKCYWQCLEVRRRSDLSHIGLELVRGGPRLCRRQYGVLHFDGGLLLEARRP